jgi:hypothetical protein
MRKTVLFWTHWVIDVIAEPRSCGLMNWNLPEGPQGIVCCLNSTDLSTCVVQAASNFCGSNFNDPNITATSRKRNDTEIVVSVLEPNKPPDWMVPLVQEHGGHLIVYEKNSSIGDCSHVNCSYSQPLQKATFSNNEEEIEIMNIGRNMCTYFHHVASRFNSLPAFTLFTKTNGISPAMIKELLRTAISNGFVGIDHPWWTRRRFLSVVCDPRWKMHHIYSLLCPCSNFPRTWQLGQHSKESEKPTQGFDRFHIRCFNFEDERAQYLRRGLPGKDEIGIKLPLIFEHYEEDMYLAHRSILRAYPLSYWKMREHECEVLGGNHVAAAELWAYLVALGSLNKFPVYLVSPGVRLYTNSSSGAQISTSRQGEWIEEFVRAETRCVVND